MRRHRHIAGSLVVIPSIVAVAAGLWPEAARSQAPGLGGPLPGLDAGQQRAFEAGKEEFLHVNRIEDGLGPVFNGRSCAECHAVPVVGGSSPNLTLSRVTRIGRLANGLFDPLVEKGGMLLQSRSLRELVPTVTVRGEVVPPEANVVSRRATTPVFGAGLIEAIPDSEILRRARQPGGRPSASGGSGVPNWVFNPETQRMEIGRFGWKGHVSSLHIFSGDAYLNEVGITNPTFPDESLPQGLPIPPGADVVPELEDDGEDVQLLTDFMRFLAPPQPKRASPQANTGRTLFTRIGCADCHIPAMLTGDNPVPALSRRRVELWSDLLLHEMGDGLADGITMGAANGRQWRTTPLWGLSDRQFLLHDGRSTTIADAIRWHGGESAPSREQFNRLTPRDRDAVLAFLSTL